MTLALFRDRETIHNAVFSVENTERHIYEAESNPRKTYHQITQQAREDDVSVPLVSKKVIKLNKIKEAQNIKAQG